MRGRAGFHHGLLGPLLGLLGLGLTVGCHTIAPEMSVEGAPQACCTEADAKLQNFAGCRIPTRKCRSRRAEKWWMRGAVHCGPVDEAACAGGRCCTYAPQYDGDLSEPVENWAPPGHAKPTNNVTDPNATPQHDLPAPSADEAVPAEEATPTDEAAPAQPEAEADAPKPDDAPVSETPAS